MPLHGEYEPPTWDIARKQVERYESSGGTDGVTQNGAVCIILTNVGAKTGKLRKNPLIRVTDGTRYACVGSMGGAPKDPGWCTNVRANPHVELQDETVKRDYLAREVFGDERQAWWDRAVEAWPAYAEYQTKTTRVIPVFVLDPFDPDDPAGSSDVPSAEADATAT